jgi:hypothetical protein
MSNNQTTLCRYKISLTAEDDTDTAEFIFFGRMAQRLIKKNVDALISTNPPGFIPREITNLLEKSFEWNVSFTESTVIYSTVSFQVNAINAEIDGGNILPATSSSQPSSTILSQGKAYRTCLVELCTLVCAKLGMKLMLCFLCLFISIPFYLYMTGHLRQKRHRLQSLPDIHKLALCSTENRQLYKKIQKKS